MLHIQRKNLTRYLDADRVYYGESRGESGVCLHFPIKNYVVGTAPGEDHALMISVANTLIDFLLYKRVRKGPEAWDYDAEKANEIYTVCGDNISSSGIIIFDRNYQGAPKLQLFLDKTFGSNEVSLLWKNSMVGDEFLLDEFSEYMKQALRNGEFSDAE